MNPRKLLLVCGVIAAVGWVLVARLIAPGNISPDQTDPSLHPNASLEVSEGSDPKPLVNDKNVKRRLVRHFVAAYYGRDARSYEGSLTDRTDRFHARLQPYVSDDFLRDYARLFDIPQEAALLEAGGSIEARIKSFDGGHDLEVPATVKRTVSLPGAKPQVSMTSLLFTLVATDDGWVVDTVEPMI